MSKTVPKVNKVINVFFVETLRGESKCGGAIQYESIIYEEDIYRIKDED